MQVGLPLVVFGGIFSIFTGYKIKKLVEWVYKSIEDVPHNAEILGEQPLDDNPVFKFIPSLRGKVAWISLGEYPTPVHTIDLKIKRLNIAEAEGEQLVGVKIWVKREDMSSQIYGGNKVRTLEHSMACARVSLEEGGRIVALGSYNRNFRAFLSYSATYMGLIVLNRWSRFQPVCCYRILRCARGNTMFATTVFP